MRILNKAVILLSLIILPAITYAEESEYWTNISKEKSTVLILMSDSNAEYSSTTVRPDGTVYFIHSKNCQWGKHLREFKGVPSLNDKVERYFWVKVFDKKFNLKFKFDYIKVGNKLFMIDKKGISDTLILVENAFNEKNF